MQILIVDDSEFMLQTLGHALARIGHTTVAAHDGQQAVEILRRGEIRLVITDWKMPGMSGLELCSAVRREHMSGYVYIIMLTGVEGAESRREGLRAGADDFLNKPLDPEDLHICLNRASRILALETRDLALFAMAKLAETRDPEVGEHLERVQNYALVLVNSLSQLVKQAHGIDSEYIRLLYQTSALHDLGKVGIPDAILLKPGRLTLAEFEIMKTHTLVGAHTLDASLQRFPDVPFLKMARDIAASHHERFNGSGYPAGLAGDQIPFCARVVALADSYDAITTRRVYKTSMTHEQAKEIILRGRGIHFDPHVVDAFIAAEGKIIDVHNRFANENPEDVKQAAECSSAGPTHSHDYSVLLTAMSRRLEALSITDDLTGALNRRQAMSRLEEQSSLAERYCRPLSLVIIDLDRFKTINDAHGHDAGDVILRRVAQILRDQATGSDSICRTGGDEFLMILSSSTAQHATALAQRCLATIACREFIAGDSSIAATVSIGVATYLPEMASFPDLLRAAEAALSAAKQAGRNQVSTADLEAGLTMDALKLTSQLPAAELSTQPPINFAEVLARCGGDADFAAALTDQFRTNAIIEVEKIETALGTGDIDGIRRNAHNVKSMAAYMAAKTAADLAQQIEQLARDNQLGDVPTLVAQLRREMEYAVQWISNDAATKAKQCA